MGHGNSQMGIVMAIYGGLVMKIVNDFLSSL